MTFWSCLKDVPHRIGWTDASGVRTRYLDAGPAAGDAAGTVLFLHGVNGHLEVFLRNVPAHARHFRVLAIDLMGHGYSAKPTDRPYEIRQYVDQVRGFLDAMEAERASLVGTSLGGWVAARLAAEAPERTASLSLVSSGGLTSYANVMKSLRDLGSEAVDGREAVRRRMAFVIKDPANIDDELVDLRTEIYAQADYQAVLAAIMCLQDPDIRARNLLTEAELGRVACPALVVWTKDDPTATVEDGRRYAAAIPGARFELFEQSAHMPQFEESARFDDLHVRFLQTALAA